MTLAERFTKETGRCSDNDVQYYAEWLEKLAEVQPTPTNTGSPKLVALADRAISQLEMMSLHQAVDTIIELRNQLRAGDCERCAKEL